MKKIGNVLRMDLGLLGARLGAALAVRARHDLARARGRSKRGERGMTLVEIMVVVVIMSLVAGVVGVAVFNALGTAQGNVAKTQIGQISDALDIYKLSHRRYPSTAEGLQALTQSKDGAKPVMETLPKDPWGNDYVYISPGSHNTSGFDILCYGSDGAAGGGDDVTNYSGE